MSGHISGRLIASPSRRIAGLTAGFAIVLTWPAALLPCGASALVLAQSDGAAPIEARVTPARLARFERILERLMFDLETPGLSALILEHQEVVWERGFGHADLEHGIAVTPDTPFGLASVTKALASVVFFRNVERGLLSLDDDALQYDAFMNPLPNAADVKLEHLMSHTSLDPVGTTFSYDGNRYGGLGNAIVRASGASFRSQLLDEIAEPLGMTRTTTGPLDPEILDRFDAHLAAQDASFEILDKLGRPYPLVSLFEYTHARYPLTLRVAQTLVANALDTTSYGKGVFGDGDPGRIGDETQQAFNRFWLDEPEQAVYREMARAYHYDEQRDIGSSTYNPYASAAAGVISTVRDLAKFDVALDQGKLIEDSSKALAWEPVRTPDGNAIPYGYGWFTAQHGGRRIVWHGGAWRGMSCMYLKVPEEDLTFIFLSNSKTQSDAFDMAEGNSLNSGFGLAFLRLFVYEPLFGATGPDIDWSSPSQRIIAQIESVADEWLRYLYRRELQLVQGMYLFMLRQADHARLLNEVEPHFSAPFEDPYASLDVIAEIGDVSTLEQRAVDFTLAGPTAVRIYAQGEIVPEGAWDYGWIVDKATGESIWSMDGQQCEHAGGASKNRRANVVLTLAAGEYTLHFKSDDSHAFSAWNARPPEHLFWGIRVLRAEQR